MTVDLVFDLSSYWRVTSGKGGGAIADSLVLRDASGLPSIPGRTVKGLIREAMETAANALNLKQERLIELFGSELPGTGDDPESHEIELEEARFSTTEGSLWFGSAQLPKEWRNWAQSNPKDSKPVRDSLCNLLASTAIDQLGVAKQHSLRVVEAAVPMTLRAQVQGPDDDKEWRQQLAAALPLLRALGSRRNRGFGRVQVKLEESR